MRRRHTHFIRQRSNLGLCEYRTTLARTLNNEVTTCYDNITSLFVSGNNLFAGTETRGIFLSTNNGTSWTAVNNGLSMYNSVVWITTIGNNLYAGFSADIFQSTNNGANWTSWPSANKNGLPDYYINCLAVSGTNIFVGTDGVYLSTDTGTSWNAINTGLPVSSLSIQALAVSGTHIFAGTTNGAYLSTNTGTSWTAINTGLPSNFSVYTFTLDGTNIFAAAGGSIFLTTNDGTNWSNIGKGPETPLAITESFLFGVDFSGNLWKRPLSELTSVKESYSKGLATNFSLNQNYPNPFNPTTTIGYLVHKSGFVTLKIFDILGREITKLVYENKPVGNYSIQFNGNNLSSGIYFYRMQAGSYTENKKLNTNEISIDNIYLLTP